MNERLAGRRVLITGASGAFGSAAMREFQRRGAIVRGLDSRPGSDVIGCDITDGDEVRRSVDLAIEQLGGLDILVNCAGIGMPVDIGAAPGTQARQTMETNLWGQWRVTSAALDALLRSRGRVIFVASALAFVNVPFAGAYAISKRALTSYADTLRVEYGPTLKVSTVYPGYVDTPIHQASDDAGVNVGAVARSESVASTVAVIVACAAKRRPPRDRGSTTIGHLQAMAGKWLPSSIDRLIAARVRRQFSNGRYRAAPVAQGMIHRHLTATSQLADPARPGRLDTVMATDGTTLHATVHDEGAASVNIVQLHGWCLSSRIFQYQPAALARLGVAARVIALDLRGHGASPQPSDDTLTIEQLADDLRAVIEKLCPDGPVILVGHSMGGITLMELAERHHDLMTERIAGVVLVNTSAGGPPRPVRDIPTMMVRVIRSVLSWELPRRQRAFARRGARVIRRRYTDAILARRLLFGETASRDLKRLGREIIATTHPATVARFWDELRRHDRRENLDGFAHLPVRILSGDKDRITPVRHGRQLAAQLPHARLMILPGAGHTIPLERPIQLASCIAALLNQRDNGGQRTSASTTTGDGSEGGVVSDTGR